MNGHGPMVAKAGFRTSIFRSGNRMRSSTVRHESSPEYGLVAGYFFLRCMVPVMNVIHWPSSVCIDDVEIIWSADLNS